MKVTSAPKQFVPVSITVTFESQEELDFFGTLFNFAPITELHNKKFDDAFSTLRGALPSATINNVRDLISEPLLKSYWLKGRVK